jgi:hypothetical protein
MVAKCGIRARHGCGAAAAQGDQAAIPCVLTRSLAYGGDVLLQGGSLGTGTVRAACGECAEGEDGRPL